MNNSNSPSLDDLNRKERIVLDFLAEQSFDEVISKAISALETLSDRIKVNEILRNETKLSEFSIHLKIKKDPNLSNANPLPGNRLPSFFRGLSKDFLSRSRAREIKII